MGHLKKFQQNLHIHHRNDSTSLSTIHFIYILVLEDVIGSDVGGRFLLAHPVIDGSGISYSCLIYARAVIEYVCGCVLFQDITVRKIRGDKVLTFLILREKC